MLMHIATTSVAVCGILFLLRMDIAGELNRDQPLLVALVAIDKVMRRSALLGLASFVLALIYSKCAPAATLSDTGNVPESTTDDKDHEE